MRRKITDLTKRTNVIEYCIKYVPLLGSKTAVHKAITHRQLKLNGKYISIESMVNNGDLLELKQPKRKFKSTGEIAIPIVFEDDFLVIVNKPGGIAVNGNRNKTVENIVRGIAQKSKQQDALAIPTAAHRLDVPTKGLVLLAKTKTALIRINKAFQTGKVEKEYMAVVHGQANKKGRITLPIQGKSASTEFTTIRTVPSRLYGHLSLLRLELITGRTHQLRIHLQSTGHLIVGDREYADNQKTILGKGLFLCACRLAILHPISGEPIEAEIEPPTRFVKLLNREENRF